MCAIAIRAGQTGWAPAPAVPARHGIERLIRALCERRGYEIVGERPLRANSASTPRAASRLGRVSEDPDARFFLQRVPDYADGRAPLVFIPLSLANVAVGLARLVLRGRSVTDRLSPRRAAAAE